MDILAGSEEPSSNNYFKWRDGENKMHMGWPEAVYFLLEKTAEYARSDAGNQGIFTPHPTTWFNQSRYLDDVRDWTYVPPARSQGVREGWLK